MKVLSALRSWINMRFPLDEIWQKHLANYYVPKNLNIWYVFGSLAIVVLIIQLLTGIWLTMFYVPTAEGAFASIQTIMREVHFGWLLRYLHTTGASAFFIIIYLHIFRSLMYGSYQKPRELVWLFGVALYFVLLAEAFMGYLLPWGQMSYWAAQVIISLFGAIPWIGDQLVTWVRGDYNVSGVTLHRFFALHVTAVPLVFLFLIRMHIVALHQVGCSNPAGIDKSLDKIPFHPYYTVKDLLAVAVFLILFLAVVFFAPDFFGYFIEPENYIPANPLQTPAHITPVWYMTPFYAMLRAVPNKLSGVIVLISAVTILFFLPWLDRSPVKSIRQRGKWSKLALLLLAVSFLVLGYLGAQAVTPLNNILARLFTILYFLFFLLMPVYSRWDRVK